MTREYELLRKVLSEIKVKEGLNIEELKTKLETQDQDLYEEWKRRMEERWI